MEEKKNIELLKPKLDADEIVEYLIIKEETFRFKDSHSKPFRRSYKIELREIEEKLFEIYYPQSILSASKYFNSLDEYFSIMKNSQNSTIFVFVNKEGELELQNHESIQTNLKKIKNRLIQQITDDEKKDEIKTLFNYLSSKEKVERYFLEDLQYIFDYYGLEKEDDTCIEYTSKESKMEALINKAMKKIGVGLSSIDLVMFDFIENQRFKIESLVGIDTISTKTRHDFERIKEDFLNEYFDFDSINDISLHHKKYIFSSKNILEKFSYRAKIDTPNMKKIKEIKIEKNTAPNNV